LRDWRAAERAVSLNPRAGTGGGLHRLNYREAGSKPDAADATPSWLRMLIFAAVKVLREARRGGKHEVTTNYPHKYYGCLCFAGLRR
jgi:hypothetical protein